MAYHLTAGEIFLDRDLKKFLEGLILGFKTVATSCRFKWRFGCELSTNIVHQAFRKQPCYSFVEFATAQEDSDAQGKSDDSVYW